MQKDKIGYVNANGSVTFPMDNWAKGMSIVYNGITYKIGWKGIVKDSKPGKNPYRCALLREGHSGKPYFVDGQEVDAILATMRNVEPIVEEENDNLEIADEEVSLILRSLRSLEKELLTYAKRSGISRFKRAEAMETTKAIKALRSKLATIES